MGNRPLRFYPSPQSISYSVHCSPTVLVTNQNYSSIQWLISHHCSTTFNFLLPSIPDITQNLKSPTAAWVEHNITQENKKGVG